VSEVAAAACYLTVGLFFSDNVLCPDGGAAAVPPYTRPEPLGQGSNFLGSGKPPYPTPGKPIGKTTGPTPQSADRLRFNTVIVFD